MTDKSTLHIQFATIEDRPPYIQDKGKKKVKETFLFNTDPLLIHKHVS